MYGVLCMFVYSILHICLHAYNYLLGNCLSTEHRSFNLIGTYQPRRPLSAETY